LFRSLQSMGKWSAAAIAAAVVGSAWFAFPPEANAGGAWVNRRGGYGGGGWINGRGGWGGGGGWLNHGGGGGAWVNRRYYGGGGAWINRWEEWVLPAVACRQNRISALLSCHLIW